MKSSLKSALLAVAVAALPATASAHNGGSHAGAFMNGLGHPVSGFDHLLAMVAVGMFAAHLGGRALWLVPTTFVLMMGVGGILGVAGMALPLVEPAIIASVVVLAFAVALRWSLPIVAATGMVGFFAIFHGHAHGSEMPVDEPGLQYAMGFMAATALLHAVGIAIGVGLTSIGWGRDRRGMV